MKKIILKSIFTLLIAAFSSTLLASTPAAWKEYRENIRMKCDKALGDRLINPSITVDSTGTDSYGIALAIGKSKYSNESYAIVCIYNEETKKIELSSELYIEEFKSIGK